MSDLIYEREMDAAYNADELAASLRKRDRTAWRLVAVCVCADGSYAVWERALVRLKPQKMGQRCPDCDNGRTYDYDDSRIDCSRCNGTGRIDAGG